MSTIETITHEDWRVRIVYDDNCDSPREYDNLGTMITWDRNYHSPNKNEFASPEEFDRWWFGNEDCDDVFRDDAPDKDPRCVRLPVYKYEHGGVAYSTGPFGCRWDSGAVGWIFTTPESVELTGAPLDSLQKQLSDEVRSYSQWASGEVYGYVVEKRESCVTCGHGEWEEVEACYGFVGEVNISMPNDAPKELSELIANAGYLVY